MMCHTGRHCTVRQAASGLPALAALTTLAVSSALAQAPDAAQQVRRGQALLGQYQCGACHAIPGIPAARGTLAQPLDAWSRRSYIAGRLPNQPAVLARWIADPPALVPGTRMPRMGVSLPEAQAMAAYLYSLP